jgi:hypothetical protein
VLGGDETLIKEIRENASAIEDVSNLSMSGNIKMLTQDWQPAEPSWP